MNTGKKIYATLMIIAAVLIALIITPSILMFSGMFYNTYESMAKNKLDRSISAGRMHIDSIMSTTEKLALNPVIAEALSGNRTDSLTSVLDGARTYSIYINAITVYGTDGKIHTSSGVISPPTIGELCNRPDISDFFADDEADDYVSLRSSEIIKAYDYTPYDENNGIISCCRKVYAADGSLCGYIFSDVFPKSLFAYFGSEDDQRLKNSVAMVAFNGGYLVSEGSDNDDKYLNAPADTIVAGRLIVSSIRNFYGGTVRLAVPVSPLYTNITLIAAAITACGGILITATHFIASATARSVTGRLNRLLVKMNRSVERFKDN